MADQDNKDDVKVPDYLNMSDEELMNAPPPSVAPVTESVIVQKEENQEGNSDDTSNEDGEDQSTETDTNDESGVSQDEEEVDGEGKKEVKEEKKPAEAQKVEGVTDPKDTTVPPATVDEVKIDYEAQYKKLLAPFKANGREIVIKDVDDAISLMQMGANYNKKMAALKPNLKLMKLLENNGLLSEEKLSFLIDLDKKNPDAINKLVKDSGINPMDIDAEKAGEYKQSTYTVDETEMALDTVLDDIKDSPTYNQTLSFVSNKWDSASKQHIAKNPELLRLINDHVAGGFTELIDAEIESEKLFGRLKGLSYLDAYKQVGDAIHERGGFNHLAKGSAQDQAKPSTPAVVVAPKPKAADDGKLNDKRRAASSTKPVAPTTTPKDFNPLALSDKDFEAMVNKRIL